MHVRKNVKTSSYVDVYFSVWDKVRKMKIKTFLKLKMRGLSRFSAFLKIFCAHIEEQKD